MAMKQAEILAKVKENTVEALRPLFEQMGAEQVGDYAYAIPNEVEGERWCVIELTAKTTMTDENGDKIPYDPFVVAEMWKADQEIKKAAAEERARKKAETLKKAEEKKAKAKANALAKKNAREKAVAETQA